MRIPFRDFKGLYTNIDPSDQTGGYVQDTYNVRFRPGYIQTDIYKSFLQSPATVEGDIVFMETVVIKDDPFGVDDTNGTFTPDKRSGNYQLPILITRQERINYYEYRLYYFEGTWKIPKVTGDFTYGAYVSHVLWDYDKLDKKVFIDNQDGIVKIFLPHDTFWFGKIHRSYHGGDLLPTDGYYLDRLSETFDLSKAAVPNIVGTDVFWLTAWLKRLQLLVQTITFQTTGNVDPEHFIWTNEEIVELPSYNNWLLSNYDGHGELHKYSALLDSGVLLSNPNSQLQNNFYFFKTALSGIYAIPEDQYLVDGQPAYSPPNGTLTHVTDVTVKRYNSNSYITLHGSFYLVYVINLNASYHWISNIGRAVEDIGLTRIDDYIEIAGTCIMDSGEEHVAYYNKLSIKSITTKFAVNLSDIYIPRNNNKRMVALAFYYKFPKQLDFEQFKFVNLLNATSVSYKTASIHSLAGNGIYLSQTIGTIFNRASHRLITTFDDYKQCNGICYGLKNNVYYPAIGNGNVQNTIFYPDRYIKNLGLSKIIRLSNIRESLGVHGQNELKQVYVQDSGAGEFIFTVKDRSGYGIKDYYDVFETPEGIIILTPRGIFITDGGTEIHLSQQINDIVEEQYLSGRIYFDNILKKIYFYLNDFSFAYTYSFVDKAWSVIIIQSNQLTFDQIYTDPDGITFLRDGNKRYILGKAPSGTAYVKLPEMDLGKLNAYKVVKAVVFDYVGSVKFDEEIITNQIRKKQIFYRSLDNREPVEKIAVEFFMADDTKVYGLEIDADIVGDEI